MARIDYIVSDCILTTMAPTTRQTGDGRVRKSAAERREQILEAAIEEFAARGLRGASVEDLAREVGVSQPYVYRLFGTKKDLFLAAIGRVRERVREAFAKAADNYPGSVLEAMGRSYDHSLFGRKEQLMLLQGFAAADDEEVREAVGEGYAELWRFVQDRSGASDEETFRFFAAGMLLTVDTAVGLMERLSTKRQPEERPWGGG